MPREDGEESSVEESETQSEFGAELRRLRLARKLTIRAVAEALDIHASLLASVEKTSLGVDIPLLKRLASFYEVTLEQIMGIEPTAPDREIVTREQAAAPRLGT
ncbi:helix-turn-helix domain-containing protein [Bradyrhizobium sp. SSUT18]|uniref:helix-turn-helix domain-containing protein n=1 Tax=Bradyrhizobium sp. SSUT18 TaxID=3040602 RepID=UPI002449E511|nr:helix-turn-helix domain-containing protein [Bradyrhizobium sp. SSUT18]MDH2400151.1 helix-turn-helix domain-containing protein [Bradyrhizobium sp. SSUT18]